MWEFLSGGSGHLMYAPARYAEIGAWPSLLDGNRPKDGADGADGADGEPEGEDPFAPFLAELGVRDILNAAWRERIESSANSTGAAADRIAAAALALWQRRFLSRPAPALFAQPLPGPG